MLFYTELRFHRSDVHIVSLLHTGHGLMRVPGKEKNEKVHRAHGGNKDRCYQATWKLGADDYGWQKEVCETSS